jgi:hypothetical protein
MVPAAIIIVILFALMCVAVGILWLERKESHGRVETAALAFDRATKAMEFEVERLQKWTKMPRDFRGGPSDFTA